MTAVNDCNGNKVKVSIICPCFNCSAYVNRLLDSIADQASEDIQLILVDDGSNDSTLHLLEQWSESHRNDFAQVKVISKDNGGAASAVNEALPHVVGEYLIWADSDDALTPGSIQVRSGYLDENPEKGMVLGQARAIDESTGDCIRLLSIPSKEQLPDLFERIIFVGIPCYPGVFMVRTKLLFEKLRERRIYFHPEVGQNWQLLLPVAFGSQCGYVNKVVYEYHIRSDSHSHGSTYAREIERTYAQSEVLSETLSFVNPMEKEALMCSIEIKLAMRRLRLAYGNKDWENLKRYLRELSDLKGQPKGSGLFRLEYRIMRLAGIVCNAM